MFLKVKSKIGFMIRGIIGFLQTNFEKIPSISNKIDKYKIGESINSNSIFCYKINNGDKKIIFVSAIHGNEVGTVKLAHYIIDWLNRNKEQWAQFTFYIIPCLNPDGYKIALNHPEYFTGGKSGRFNAHNVDLNRNFNTPDFQSMSVWSFGKNYSKKSKVFCGEYGNSEPEIQALTKFIIKQKIKVLFMFHNVGCDVMGNNNQLSQKLVKNYSQITGFNYISEKEWKKLTQTGTAKKWCDNNNNNIVYIEVEGSTRWGSDWKRQKNAIISTLNELKKVDLY